MAKNVYLKDIAKLLNISQNTVSLALRGMPGVKESTREKILNTARQIGYLRNTAEPSTIFLVTTLDNSTDTYFYSFMQRAIEDELNRFGYKLVAMHFINDNQVNSLQIPRLINQIEPRGILILGELDAAYCLELMKSNLPVVCVDFYYPDIVVDSVIEDNISGIYSVLEYMTSKGYKSFGFIGDIKNYISIWERWMAFVGYLTEYGIGYNPTFCIVGHPLNVLCNSDWLVNRLDEMELLPEAFICGNDKIAATVIKALYTLGYNTPRDIGITGFDNSEIAKITVPSLTTVDSFRDRQSLATVNVLMDKIKQPKKAAQRVVVPVRFVEGASTREIST
jgi:LacI family transcriptional regulator